MRKQSVLEQLLSVFWLAIGPSDPRHLLVLMDVINDFTFSTFLLSNSLLDAKVSQNELQNGPHQKAIKKSVIFQVGYEEDVPLLYEVNESTKMAIWGDYRGAKALKISYNLP